ncbi:MAG: hypothetical protein ACJ74I_18035 [Gaiellaceae bacterium]
MSVGTPASPYKGLNAFDDSDLDALLFFGREREREIVAANLAASRLTVLYGPSGVGKSSLLSAAVARSLRQLPETPLVIVFSRWSDDPAAALASIVATQAGAEANGSATNALVDAQLGRDVYLILDQTEEYFLYHADDAGPDSMAETLPIVLAGDYRINVLISLREDSLAELDRFTGRISGLFANTLRLDRLDRDAARSAIVGPVQRFVELTGQSVAVEPALVERVLDEVGAGRIEPALGGRGSVEGGVDGVRIETPYLQLVMQRLWDEERARGSDVLRAETLVRLGGARRIVEEHLEGAIAELTVAQRDVAARLFNHLVTPSGTKIAHTATDLADFGQVRQEELQPALDRLTDRRILRSIDEAGSRRYEIFHDVLAEPVLAWRARHRTEREVERKLAEAHRRRRTLQRLFAFVVVVLGLMTAVTVFALQQRGQARSAGAEAKREAKVAEAERKEANQKRQQAEAAAARARRAEADALRAERKAKSALEVADLRTREARIRTLEAEALGAVDADPQLSLQLATKAATLARNRASEDLLRETLKASSLRSVARAAGPVVAASARSGSLISVTAHGAYLTTNRETGRTLPSNTGIETRAASFADDGSALLTGDDGIVRILGPGRPASPIPGVAGMTGGALAADGRRAVVFNEHGAVVVDADSGGVIRRFSSPDTLAAAISRDGRFVATGHDKRVLRVWDARTGRLVRKVTSRSGLIVTVALSVGGDLVAAADSDGVGQVWRVADGVRLAVLTGHQNALTDVEFSPSGDLVVTASRDKTMKVWLISSSLARTTLRGDTQPVTSAHFVGGDSLIVSASADGTARLWDVAVPELQPLAHLGVPVTRVDYGRQGRDVLATAQDGRVHVLDASTGAEVRTQAAARASATVTGPNGSTAEPVGNDVLLRFRGITRRLQGHRDAVTSVAFSPNGRLLVTASKDNDARIWDVATGKSRRVLSGHLGSVQEARFSPDGRWVVTAGSKAGIWNVRSGERLMFVRGHTEPLTSATFDRTGRTILTGGLDGTVRTYRCELCGNIEDLLALAKRRLAAVRR